jgi:hypothetical protein
MSGALALLALAIATPVADASRQSDRREQLRYARETMNLSHSKFMSRKADFTAKGCNADHPKRGGCKKPSPYNRFDWTSDGCSWTPASLKRLFKGPCAQHDFGYRNFGKNLTLGRSESTRAWIDGRFREEMRRTCDDSFPRLWQRANRGACFNEAEVMWRVVQRFSNWTPPEPGRPAPVVPEPLEPLPPLEVGPLPELTPVPTPLPTYPETTGGPTNTWTNHTNAGGTQGPTIPARTTVQIACKLHGFRVANGNTWWYRIASSPWSGNYYASADAFYNNGQTSGSLRGTPFVDPQVRDC